MANAIQQLSLKVNTIIEEKEKKAKEEKSDEFYDENDLRSKIDFADMNKG